MWGWKEQGRASASAPTGHIDLISPVMDGYRNNSAYLLAKDNGTRHWGREGLDDTGFFVYGLAFFRLGLMVASYPKGQSKLRLAQSIWLITTCNTVWFERMDGYVYYRSKPI